MSGFLPILISWVQLYGYPVLWASVFVASVGIPLPIGLALLAAGAFAALGDFNIVILALIAISASVAGDCTGYWIGRRVGPGVLLWLKQKRRVRFISPQAIARSQIYFQQRGGWAIFLSRFLFSALGGTMNILSGAEEYPFRRFLLYDTCGETIGCVLPLTLGFAFGESWEAVGDVFATISAFTLALLVAIYLTQRLIRMLRAMKTPATGRELGHLTGEKVSRVDSE